MCRHAGASFAKVQSGHTEQDTGKEKFQDIEKMSGKFVNDVNIILQQ